MSIAAAKQRFSDDSDVYVTFDPRTRVLDVPDDGRVAELLPGRTHARRPSTSTGFDRRDGKGVVPHALPKVKSPRRHD